MSYNLCKSLAKHHFFDKTNLFFCDYSYTTYLKFSCVLLVPVGDHRFLLQPTWAGKMVIGLRIAPILTHRILSSVKQNACKKTFCSHKRWWDGA